MNLQSRQPWARTWLTALVLLIAGIAALRIAGNTDFWRRYLTALVSGTPEPVAAQITPRLVVKGAEGGAMPEATPEVEGIFPLAVTEAIDAARRQGASALVVHRHGHRIAAYFAAGRDGSTLLTGGQLSPALLMLATGTLADSRQLEFGQAVAAFKEATAQSGNGWRNPWSAAARARFGLSAPPAYLMKDLDGTLARTLSLRVLQPLQAGDAYLWGVDDSRVRLDCCVVARLDDWMRIGDLLQRQGEYEGTRIVSVDWMRQVLAADADGTNHPIWVTASPAWTGDEPPAAHETYWFDLGPDVRLWLLPRRGLSILFWSATGSGQSRDTTIPNLLIRGIVEQSVAPGATTNLGDLVPGH